MHVSMRKWTTVVDYDNCGDYRDGYTYVQNN